MRLVRQPRGPCSPPGARPVLAGEANKTGTPADPCTAESISLQAGADDGQPAGNPGLRKVPDGRRWLNRAAAVAAELVGEPQIGAAQPDAAPKVAGRKSPQAEKRKQSRRDKKSG